ncbi:MAG: porin family protein [Alphaproteobacteria bacterium]|nr:porin family protein [Alphaproteobacteria bacterium]
MKFFKLMMLAGVVTLPLAVAAQAADNNAYVPSEASTMTGFYLRGDLGANYLTSPAPANVWAFNGGGGFGYQFSDNFRADVTGNWTSNYNVAPGATLSTADVMGNVYFDWKNDSPITPYVGVGAGYGWVNRAGIGVNDQGVAIGATAGVSMDMTNNLALDVGYHFKDIMIAGDDAVDHSVTAGLRFKF